MFLDLGLVLQVTYKSLFVVHRHELEIIISFDLVIEWKTDSSFETDMQNTLPH